MNTSHTLRALTLALLMLSCVASSALGGILIVANKAAQTLTVSVDGQRLYSWPTSTGREGYDTPAGTYSVIPSCTRAGWVSAVEWDVELKNPICFRFAGVYQSKSGPVNMYDSIHGMNAPGVGQPHSHGCIRLSNEHSDILFPLVEARLGETTVVVVGATKKRRK